MKQVLQCTVTSAWCFIDTFGHSYFSKNQQGNIVKPSWFSPEDCSTIPGFRDHYRVPYEPQISRIEYT